MTLRQGLAAALLVVATGCGGPPPAFEPLRTAAIVPGEGLGTLTLGTTLEAVTTRYGVSQSAAIASDDYYAELRYPEVGLVLLFAIVDGCREDVLGGGARALAEDLRDPAAFLAAKPDCRSAPLVGVTVARTGGDEAFFTGATPSGIRVGTTRDELLEEPGLVADPRGLMLAGEGPGDDRLERVVFLDGVAAFLGPQEGSELWQVQRLAIFDPETLGIADP